MEPFVERPFRATLVLRGVTSLRHFLPLSAFVFSLLLTLVPQLAFAQIETLRFRPSWIEAESPQEVYLSLDSARGRAPLTLELLDSANAGYPLVFLGDLVDGEIEVTLPSLPRGVYDLKVETGTGVAVVRDMLRVGEGTLRKVPEEYATIAEALSASERGDEIVLASGIYRESVTVDRPIRIRSATSEPNEAKIIPGKARGVHVLESAGRIVELRDLLILGAEIAGGRGAGILAESPIGILDCRIIGCESNGEGSIGGGVWATAGTEIRGSELTGNSVGPAAEVAPDPFVEPSTGTAGGIYCIGCRVEETVLENNTAAHCGHGVIDGVLRDSQLGSAGLLFDAHDGAIESLALRGKVEGNRFQHYCGSNVPSTVLISGPAEASFNTFTNRDAPICEDAPILQVQGPVKFFNNTLANYALQICGQHQVPRTTARHFRVHNNLIFPFYYSFRGSIQSCEDRLDLDATVYQTSSLSTRMWSNLGRQVRIFTLSGELHCPDCVLDVGDVKFCELPTMTETGSAGEFDLRLRDDSPALPQNEPYIEGLIGAVSDTCGTLLPVRIQFANVAWEDDAVVLEWALGADLEIVATQIERRVYGSEGTFIEVGPVLYERCAPTCRYQDSSVLAGESYEYRVVAFYSDGNSEAVRLGHTAPNSGRPSLSLELPFPNPARDEVEISFTNPVSQPLTLELVDASGRRVRTLWDDVTSKGAHRVTFHRDGDDLASGMYWIRLRNSFGEIHARRLLMVR